VAALAAGIAIAASEIVPDAGRRMRQRIRATRNPEEDVDVLAELFAEDLQAWPSEAWLVIDDHHFAMESPVSERFMELLTQETPMQVLLTSRKRPSWCTARRVLYGELQEIDRQTLAMDDREATTVLGRDTHGLRERARGWPAVIGLAALASSAPAPAVALPEGLYRYFAEEIFAALDHTTRDQLARLSLAGEIDPDLAGAILGEQQGAEALRTGVRLGVFVGDRDNSYVVHPLLQDFLETQLREDPQGAERAAIDVGQSVLARGQWDDAFDLADRFASLDLAERVLGTALERLLQDGRVATIGRWLEKPVVLHAQSPVVHLAEAELAFRRADHIRAEALAGEAASRLPPSSPLRPRALIRAGQCAFLASRESEGLDYLRRAKKSAVTAGDRREATVGLFYAASELGLPEAADFLADLEDLNDGSAETALRLGVARLTQATRDGAIGRAIRQARLTENLVEKAGDPLASTSFLHMLANALNLSAAYDEASEVIESLFEIAHAFRVEMPLPHALLNRALTEHGRRHFADAHKALDQIGNYVPPGGDIYLEFSSAAIRGRILLSEHRLQEARAAVSRSAREIPSPPLRAEYLASQALVLSCSGDQERPPILLAQALATFESSVERKVLGACVEAIGLGEENPEFESAVKRVWAVADETENFDGVVCGYRSYPPLLRVLASASEIKRDVLDLVVRARDEQIARSAGVRLRLSPRAASDRLTPREAEVYGLLRSGLSNRSIAEALVISQATVKVHVRHIYEKLGVRTRAEALARELGDGGF
jgi:DNA-binding CsgD family transcriptional regulator/tetratricopeptide (TPR) repeat protein